MKKQNANGKKAAAHDVEPTEAPKAAKKTTVEKLVDERYTIGQTDTVRRGLLKKFCDFVRKRGTVSTEQLVAEFSGRTIDKHPVNAARVRRYVAYARNHGHIKVAK
jgi:hypothetical protein